MCRSPTFGIREQKRRDCLRDNDSWHHECVKGHPLFQVNIVQAVGRSMSFLLAPTYAVEEATLKKLQSY